MKTRHLIILLIILLAAAFVRIYASEGLNGTDDITVGQAGLQIAESGFKAPPSHWFARIGLTFPAALVFSFFGVGEWQLALIPYLLSLFGILLAYKIGEHLVSPEVGLVAGLLLALFPLDVLYARTLFPDMPLGIMLTLSFYLALGARGSKSPYLWTILSGLAWGYAYLIKVEAVFMGIVFVAMAFGERKFWKQSLQIIVVFGLVVSGENLYYYFQTGEILHRLHVINKMHMKVAAEHSGVQLWIFPKAWFITFYDFGLYYYCLFAAAIWTVFTRQKKMYLLLLWVFVYLLWLQFGTNPFSSGPYCPKSHLPRYCAMVSVPVCVLIACFLWELNFFKKIKRRVVLIGLLVFSSLFFINFNVLNGERQTATKMGIRYAVEQQLFPLYLDRTSHVIANFLLHGSDDRNKIFRFQKHNFQTGKTEMVPIDDIKGYLLLNKGFMKYASRRYYMDYLDLDEITANHEIVHTVNNPMNKLSYLQVRFMISLSSFIPLDFIRNKIQKTGKELLEQEDLVIVKMADA